MKLTLNKIRQSGDMAWEYHPLHNLVETDGKSYEIKDFDTDELDIDLNHPVNITSQPSYDGTVNLIINDDKNPPRIVNTRFTKIEDNRYRIITRNQKEQTNLYKKGMLDRQTRLFRTLNSQPKIRLKNVLYHGQLAGGNYTFYIKLADNDYNKTDIVAESGAITVFKGSYANPSTVSGTLLHESTDKSIRLTISDIDTSFSRIYVYYTREYSDTNGFRKTEYKALEKPYDITGETMEITINGYEDTVDSGSDEINNIYMYVDTVKTQAQVQNRLFFGNVTEPVPENTDLQAISHYIQVTLKQGDTIGNLTESYGNKTSSISKTEYYNPQNLYYKLGYWPDEIYRLGIVYIMNNDELTPVYNLRGHVFERPTYKQVVDENTGEEKTIVTYDNNFDYGDESAAYSTLYTQDTYGQNILNYLPKEDFLTTNPLDNTLGVFKNPQIKVLTDDGTAPLYYEMVFHQELVDELKKHKIKGFFFVRQKRIPTILGQALEVGVQENAYLPMLWDGEAYQIESFLSKDRLLTTNLSSRIQTFTGRQCSGLLSMDAIVTPTLASKFDGGEYVVEEESKTTLTKSGRHYTYKASEDGWHIAQTCKLVNVPSDTPASGLDTYTFSTRAGEAIDTSKFAFLEKANRTTFTKKDPKVARGIYTGFLGTNAKLVPGSIYNIKMQNYNTYYMKEYFSIRGTDVAPFYAITDRYELDDFADKLNDYGTFSLDAYRGDCYVNQVTIRLNRNFTDPDMPIDDIIVNEETWKNHYKGYYGALYKNGRDATDDRTVSALEGILDNLTGSVTNNDDDKRTMFYKMNRADLNAVPLGIWVTYKCLSNYNLNLRAADTSNVQEYALMGNPRGFYPLNAISTKSSYKIPESATLNDGYSSTVGRKNNFIYEDVPYIKDQFDNRIAFSDVQVDDQFKNAYRIFQGLSYRDIDRQYGAIVKLIPWGADLLCIFEHGVATVPINEKSIFTTEQGQDIRLKGADVIQSQVTVHSPDFGSTWADSVIRTPIGVYGVDTDAKKIWRFTPSKGLETISDMHIQRFLNENIDFEELDKYPIISLINVKTHYNNFKGDVMFTFYNYKTGKEWNMCYNERLDMWTTQYSWTPLFSENINNIFWSFDRKRAEVLAYVYDNQNTEHGLRSSNCALGYPDASTKVSLVGYDLADGQVCEVLSAYTSKLVNGEEVEEAIDLSHFEVNGDFIYIKDFDIVPWYIVLKVKVTPFMGATSLTPFETTLAFVQDTNNEEYTKLMGNGFYLHGRAGKFDEISYDDATFENQILPCKWYDKQEPFEIEFVVNGKLGLHKIFNNLTIISNNVSPEEFEFEIIGDTFDWNKQGIYRAEAFNENEWDYTDFNRSKLGNYKKSQIFKNASIKWDTVLNSYTVKMQQKAIDMKKTGRIQGNIQYKEDGWYLVIDPIKWVNKYFVNGEEIVGDDLQTGRVRDKYCRVRVKYSGKDLAIITAIKTMMTISYA